MSIKVARSFRLKKNVDDAITNLMGEENRNRNNLVELLIEEALRARRAMPSKTRPKKRVESATR